MAIYKESGVYTSVDKTLRWGSLLLMVGLVGLEIYYVMQGAVHLDTWFFAIALIALWCWRCGFDYTYSYNPKEFIIERRGLGMEKIYKYSFTDIENISYECDRKLFKRDGIDKYASRFSSSDANDLRLAIVQQNGKRIGVMFKSTGALLDKMKKLQPAKFAPASKQGKGV